VIFSYIIWGVDEAAIADLAVDIVAFEVLANLGFIRTFENNELPIINNGNLYLS
jgi:hypothetical protein